MRERENVPVDEMRALRERVDSGELTLEDAGSQMRGLSDMNTAAVWQCVFEDNMPMCDLIEYRHNHYVADEYSETLEKNPECAGIMGMGIFTTIQQQFESPTVAHRVQPLIDLWRERTKKIPSLWDGILQAGDTYLRFAKDRIAETKEEKEARYGKFDTKTWELIQRLDAEAVEKRLKLLALFNSQT
jgi:hypothetical protein